MIRLAIIALLLAPVAALANSPCKDHQDEYEITDRGSHSAEVRYFNNGYLQGGEIHGCTGAVPDTLVSKNGIAVRISVMVGGMENDNAERITVTPVSPEYQAIPAEAWVKDGSEIIILVTRGLM